MKLRKFLSLLMVAALFVGFTSCSDDDDKDTIPSSVVGTWKYSRSDFDFKCSISEIEKEVKDMINSGDYDISEDPHTIILREDNTFSWMEGNMEIFGGAYTYSNGTLTWNDGYDDFSFKVTASGNDLKLSFSVIDEMEDELGMSASMLGISKADIIYVYQKQ